jgi:hypothetical protein
MPTVPVSTPTAKEEAELLPPGEVVAVCTYQISPKIITICSGAQIIVTSR